MGFLDISQIDNKNDTVLDGLFQMAYGQEVVLPIKFLVPSLRIAIKERIPMEES